MTKSLPLVYAILILSGSALGQSTASRFTNLESGSIFDQNRGVVQTRVTPKPSSTRFVGWMKDDAGMYGMIQFTDTNGKQSIIEVREGAILPDGSRVMEITSGGIQVSLENQTILIPMEASLQVESRTPAFSPSGIGANPLLRPRRMRSNLSPVQN